MFGHGTEPVVLEGVPVRLALDPDSDSDGDGATDFEESQAGTDPLDPNSVFRLTFGLTTGRTLRLSFPALPGRKYHLQSSEGSFPGFTDVEGVEFPVSTTSTNMSFDLELDNRLRKERLFRVRLIP